MVNGRFARVLALLCITGCGSWRVQEISPEVVIVRHKPSAVLVTRQDGSRVVVSTPTVAGDSVRGMTGNQPLAIATSDISSISLRRRDGPKTAWLMLGGAVAAFLGLAAASAADY